MAFGRQVIDSSLGRNCPASADGNPEYKIGGVTIDWDTVEANPAEVTLADGTIIPADEKYLPFGAILTEITSGGKYGPYNAGAGDGRQTPARGTTFILNETVRFTDPHHETPRGVFDGGRVYRARLKILTNDVYGYNWTNTGAWAAVDDALPRVTPVDV